MSLYICRIRKLSRLAQKVSLFFWFLLLMNAERVMLLSSQHQLLSLKVFGRKVFRRSKA